MDSSRQDLLIDMVVGRFILKNNQITLSLVSFSSLKQVWDYLKQKLIFTVLPATFHCRSFFISR